MLRKLKLILNTIKYLKPVQLKYQVLYRLRKAKAIGSYDSDFKKEAVNFLQFEDNPPVYTTYLSSNQFIFLNVSKSFPCEIDWNYGEYGKLWKYNLQYAHFLLQKDITPAEKQRLVSSLHDALRSGKIALEPYPASLRAINIIRFLSEEKMLDPKILQNLHAELDFISRRPEYHLLGNHLLENAFALMMGGAFFSNFNWLKQGQDIIIKELNEQVLSDGAHFELSTMYHQIILFRLLELIDWYKTYSCRDELFLKFLYDKASRMCAWLKNMTFIDGTIPYFNDSSEGIAYRTEWLLKYAKGLNIFLKNIPLGESGYRSVNRGRYECRIDFAQIGAQYQPGHAHADTLSFVLHYNGKPLFVETGTSTYAVGAQRQLERSTAAHNTVVVNGENQSQVWAAFRVGKRAKTRILKDAVNEISAAHDGYADIGIKHQRTFFFDENSVSIEDIAYGNRKLKLESHLHIAPHLDCAVEGNKVHVGDDVIIEFLNCSDIEVAGYMAADGFNKYLDGKKIIVSFAGALRTEILFKTEH